MDEIEFDDPTYFPCECCGNTTTQLIRFVNRGGSAFAVYYASFTDAADHEFADVLIGLGTWGGDDTDPERDRVAFACRLWLADGGWNVSVVDADDTPWPTTVLGRRLKASEALAHPWLSEVFALTDQMVLCDEPLKTHFLSRAGLA